MHADTVATGPDLTSLGARIVEAAYLEGDFVLRSGRRSRYYLDKFRFTTRPELLWDIGRALAERLPPGTQRVAGPELGAVPLAAAVSLVSGLPSVLVRSQAKAYGTGRRFEGELAPGDRVTLLEDVVTTGGQAIASAQALREFGAHVELTLVVVDRQEGAAQAFHAAGHPFQALFTSASLGLAA